MRERRIRAQGRATGQGVDTGAGQAGPGEPAGTICYPEVEAYWGQIEWYRLADGQGRSHCFGLVNLTDRAGQSFWSGANRRYKLVILLDGHGTGQAYPFHVGSGEDSDYLSPDYVEEKLGQALPGRQDLLFFTRALALLLGRLTVNDREPNL